VADRAGELGADLPELAEPTRQALTGIMPAYGTVQNPLDVTGAAIIDPSIFTRSIEAMSADPSIGVIGVVNGLPWIDNGRPYLGQMFVDAIGAGIGSAQCPVAYVNQVLQPITGYTQAVMERGQVPYAIPGLRQAVVALRNIGWWSQATRQDRAPARPEITVPDLGLRRGPWSEQAARQLLSAAGIPVVPGRLVTSAGQAAEAAVEFGAEFGTPVVLKVVSPRILHKSDIGGVRLNVPADERAVRDAYAAVTAAAGLAGDAQVEGVLVSPMRSGGTELLAGVVRDPQWGPVLAVAPGGIFAEALEDSVLAPLPVTPGAPVPRPAARPGGPARQPGNQARRPGRPGRRDRPDRRPGPGPGRRAGIPGSEPAAGRRGHRRGPRRRGHLDQPGRPPILTDIHGKLMF
jgi:acyl-CoA synthetase (NDP forming)